MTTTQKSADLFGRILIAAMFIDAGVPKVGAFAATQAYMASAGVPGALLPAVIALEVLGGIALILGYRTRIVAMVMAAFTVARGVALSQRAGSDPAHPVDEEHRDRRRVADPRGAWEQGPGRSMPETLDWPRLGTCCGTRNPSQARIAHASRPACTQGESHGNEEATDHS